MNKLLVCSPDLGDACSFYRAAGVFRHLKAEGWQIDFADLSTEATDPLGTIPWQRLASYDCVFVQRPKSNYELGIYRHCSEMGIKLWVDYDDDFFNVPMGNPTYELYSSPGLQGVVDTLVRHADIVTVTTEALRDQLSGRRVEPIHVIPNAFDDYTFGQKPKTPTQFRAMWLWRGSHSHHPDLKEALPEFVRAQKETLGEGRHEFVFIGSSYWPVLEALDWKNKQQNNGVHLVDPALPYSFVRGLASSCKDGWGRFGVVPLVDSGFNRCKSNIAWFEFTYANSVVIAPGFLPEWIKPGIVNYTKEQNLFETYKDLVEHGDPVEAIDTSWEYIQDNYRLSKINVKRFDILQGLAK
jgi:hypothetical protein